MRLYVDVRIAMCRAHVHLMRRACVDLRIDMHPGLLQISMRVAVRMRMRMDVVCRDLHGVGFELRRSVVTGKHRELRC